MRNRGGWGRLQAWTIFGSVTWASSWSGCAANVKGDEKGESQIFLDRLFQAFGQRGCLEVGGQPEFRLRKPAQDGGGIAFADYVWKPVVLIEMKKRGADLSRHYRQAFDYWIRLAPGRPQWVVLCNFDEFWIYDFDSAQMDCPLDRVNIAELPDRYGPLAFLFPTGERPIFGNNHEEVTRQAADCLATCFTKISVRGVERGLAQRFILQTLVALFADHIGLLPRYILSRTLAECKAPSDSFDLLGGLFAQMNSPSPASGGRFKDVDYFDGGIFAQPAPGALRGRAGAARGGGGVRLVEGTSGDLRDALRAFAGQGAASRLRAHFTSPLDIMKIVGPTIVEPWRDAIESARTVGRLTDLRERMTTFTVLDPACGSGNFLYIAYRELKRLEFRLNERLTEMSARHASGQAAIGLVTARQFYGIDVNPFAVEVAKVSMMIARKLAIDELHVSEAPLPLSNLNDNFITADALISQEQGQFASANDNSAEAGHPSITSWPKADVIIGNPPFLGSRYMAKAHGYDYVRRVHAAYPQVPKMADYCVYWLRRAQDALPECTKADPFAGRAGLVGTQNIRNNQLRVGGLDYVASGGTIVEAVDNQPWSGEANVHVSIVNWVKTKDKALLPAKRRLWSKIEKPAAARRCARRAAARLPRSSSSPAASGAHQLGAVEFNGRERGEAPCSKYPTEACVPGAEPGA